MYGFNVLSGGPLTTLQDLGREHCSHLGITSSGAMDEYAYRWTQKLLGNENGNAIEILLSGLKLQATAATTIAVCGADLGFHINGSPVPVWQTHTVKTGDILSFEQRNEGMRAYLAVKGGFDVPKYEESFSTTLREGKGKRLEKGDLIAFSPEKNIEVHRVPQKYIPNYPAELTLRIVPSCQHHYFTKEQKQRFFSSTYTLTPQISRMGYKLQGDALTPSKGDIISEGITFGAVQIPPDGQPIILLKERQTIGGYPKIGAVLPHDCFKLAQLPIGAAIRFREISIEDGQREMRAFYDFFKS